MSPSGGSDTGVDSSGLVSEVHLSVGTFKRGWPQVSRLFFAGPV